MGGYVYDGDSTKIKGPDDTEIGNVGDRLKVDSAAAANVVSSGNSSTATLTAGSTFTGSWVDVLDYEGISIQVKASHASAADGVKIEWSANGSTVHADDLFNHAGTHGDQWTFGTPAQYFRIRYVNGGTNQSSFSLQTILHRAGFKPSSHRIGDMVDDDDDAELTKTVITGRDSLGVYRTASVDEDGNLTTAIAPGASIVPTLGTALRYDDMNAGTGGIARGTSITAASGWNKVYEYSGTGLLMGVKQTLEDLTGTDTNYWRVRFVIDGSEIFGASGISCRDMTASSLYNWNTGTTPSPTWAGLNIVQDTITWDSPNNLPVTFTSNVKVYVRRQGTTTKVWRAGLVCIVKVT